MRIAVVTAIVLLNAAACASKATEPFGPCAQRIGTYRSSFVTRTGNCGDVPEQIATIRKQPTAPVPPCTGSVSDSADNCTVTLDQTCQDDASRVQERGNVHWSKDASSATGTVQFIITLFATGQTCQGTYDMSVVRQ